MCFWMKICDYAMSLKIVMELDDAETLLIAYDWRSKSINVSLSHDIWRSSVSMLLVENHHSDHVTTTLIRFGLLQRVCWRLPYEFCPFRLMSCHTRQNCRYFVNHGDARATLRHRLVDGVSRGGPTHKELHTWIIPRAKTRRTLSNLSLEIRTWRLQLNCIRQDDTERVTLIVLTSDLGHDPVELIESIDWRDRWNHESIIVNNQNWS